MGFQTITLVVEQKVLDKSGQFTFIVKAGQFCVTTGRDTDLYVQKTYALIVPAVYEPSSVFAKVLIPVILDEPQVAPLGVTTEGTMEELLGGTSGCTELLLSTGTLDEYATEELEIREELLISSGGIYGGGGSISEVQEKGSKRQNIAANERRRFIRTPC